MDFTLDKKHEMARSLFKEFAETEVKPLAQETDETEAFPAETVKKMQKYGFMGIPVPKEYGGQGCDPLTYVMCVEELSKVCATTGVVVSAHTSLCIDPVMTSAYILTELQTIISRTIAPLDSAVLTIGKITGGTAANIIPDEVVMEGTVRTVSNETRALMEEKIRQIVSHGAAAMGGECDIVYQKGVPAVVCDNHVVDLIEQAATEELGADHVVTLATPSMGSEDFSRYLEKVPGAMFRIGTRNDDPASSRPLHNAGIVFDEQAITSGASVFAGLALRYLH